MEQLKVDLCVIGGGSGGLSVAAGAAQMGVKVALIERGKMGGDCLNYGCVPSKSLLAAAKAAANMRHASRFGVNDHVPEVDYRKVRDHVRGVIAAIAPHDSVERFESLGVKVIQGEAKFSSPTQVMADNYAVSARRFIVATGSSAAVPPIEGVQAVPFLTNETIFDLDIKPDHLIVIGGGPIGCELAQAHLLLGAKVTVLEMFSIMPKDDPECVAVVKKQLLKDGLVLHEGIKVLKVEKTASGVAVSIERDGKQERIEGSHLLVAAGRKPNLNGLDLEKANVAYTPKGIKTDARLRTSNKKIFAIGDAAGSFQFTHAANYHAGIIIRNALFRLPAKVNYKAMPWVTYTEPELAHVGMTEEQAKKQRGTIQVLRFNLSENDRAQAEHETEGFIKVVTGPKGIILGATIVGAQAGELILPWVLAINNKLKIKAMADCIVPYPTLSEINKRVAGQYFLPFLRSEKTKKIIRFLAKFG